MSDLSCINEDSMSGLKQAVIVISVTALFALVFFYSNIRGYYRYEELCKIEKDKQLISLVEPNKGWIYNAGTPTLRRNAYHIAASPHVRFVRFMDYDDRQLYDIVYIGANKPPRSEIIGWSGDEKLYDIKPADLVQKPTYAWRDYSQVLPNELRTVRYGTQIIDLRTNKVVSNLSDIGYSLLDRKHTLLDTPLNNTCEWKTTYLGSDENVDLIFGK